MKIVCVGDCGVDHYVHGDERRAGGITGNFALQARNCFDKTDSIRIIAPLGNDKNSIIVQRRFEDSGIECHFAFTDGSTPVQHIKVAADGERKFVGYEEGVLRNFRVSGEHAAIIEDSDLVVVPVFEQNRDMFDSIMSAPRPGITSVDFSDFAEQPDFDFLKHYFQQIDIAFFGLRSDQAGIFDDLQSLASEHGLLLVVTLGAAGSRAFHSGKTYEAAAEPVDSVIDTTGAGDAFAAGFLSCYCRSRDVEAALSSGATVAAMVVQRLGAN